MNIKKILFIIVTLLLISMPIVLLSPLQKSLDSRRTATRTSVDPLSIFDENKAYAEVKGFCETGTRVSGTEGSKRAAIYLANRLTELGVSFEVDEFRDQSSGEDRTFRNVIGKINGTTDSIIILASHYDTKGGINETFVGANDSGSSTGLLLELARTISKLPRSKCSFIFAFFDGEECIKNYTADDGLHGSKRMADMMVQNGTASNVKAMILLDMIGDKDLTVTIPHNSTPALKTLAFQSAHQAGVRGKFSLYRSNILDDHVPFLEKGIPAIDFIDFEFGSSPGKNDYWHTSQDTIDKISPTSLGNVGTVILIMLKTLAGI